MKTWSRAAYALLLAAGSQALPWWSPPQAEACSCGNSTVVTWPYADAGDVALLASIVVLRASWPEVVAPAYLEAADGTVVSLEIQNTLVNPQSCIGQVEFLRPMQTLSPFTTYTVKFDLSQIPADLPQQPHFLTPSFTTGMVVDEELPSAITVDVFHALSSPACLTNAAEGCTAFAEAKMGSDDLSGPPTWLRLSSAAESVLAPLGRGVVIDPSEPPPPRPDFVSLVVPLSAPDECIFYERIDSRGEVIEQREICEINKCAYSRPQMPIGCRPAYLPFGPRLWDQVSNESCAAPPEVFWDSESSEWQVVPAAAPAEPDDADEGKGAVEGGGPEQTVGADDTGASDADAQATPRGDCLIDDESASASCNISGAGAAVSAWAWLALISMLALRRSLHAPLTGVCRRVR